MKRYVLLVGGTGARMMDALICAVSAGVYPAGTLKVLLADTDHRGVQSAALLKARLADYDRIHQALLVPEGGFRTTLRFTSWPERLPGDASALSEWTAGSEADKLLCQALFDGNAAGLDLHEGFHGSRMLGQVTFAGLLHEAAQNPDDPLNAMVEEMAREAESGEEVRVVLAGSVCSGTGAAGIPALAAFIQERTRGSVRMGAVLLAACTDQQDAAKAKEAIAQYARDGLCSSICVLGLPASARPAAPAEYARLTDWLAAYCMDVLLHRPAWLDGVFTVRAEEGPLSWSVFGKAAGRYREAYGRLFKAAAAWTYCIGPEVERRLRKPFFLRDMFGWYASFYRRREISREEELETVASVTRLMRVLLLWLGGICKTLPMEMRCASAMQRARQEATEHYDALTELASHLCVMDDDAQRSELYDETLVHRHYTPEVTETEHTLRRIDAVKQEIARRTAQQVALNRKMGGTSVMTMLENALEKADAEATELRECYAEANRRIDHAETIASAEDQYRITDARTKLKRMERHQLMLDSRAERIREDLAAAVAEEVRFDRPAMAPSAAENGMFLPGLAERLLQREPLTRAEVEAMWGDMIQPGETVSLKYVMKAIRRANVRATMPSISLLHALMKQSMEEV
ncbi:MAG: hypothetical protein IJZ74_07250 [Clostridia bacterium]|nr:hypothetical protein [Clostridia bacterium]